MSCLPAGEEQRDRLRLCRLRTAAAGRVCAPHQGRRQFVIRQGALAEVQFDPLTVLRTGIAGVLGSLGCHPHQQCTTTICFAASSACCRCFGHGHILFHMRSGVLSLFDLANVVLHLLSVVD